MENSNELIGSKKVQILFLHESSYMLYDAIKQYLNVMYAL
jgi:hypothetical protein